MVTVIVDESTTVACKDSPIVGVMGDMKFSPVMVTGTLVPCTVLVGDMLCTTGGGMISKLYQADSSLTGT